MLGGKNGSKTITCQKFIGKGRHEENILILDSDSLLVDWGNTLVKLDILTKKMTFKRGRREMHSIADLVFQKKKGLAVVAYNGGADCLLGVVENKDLITGLATRSSEKPMIFGFNLEHLSFDFCFPLLDRRLSGFSLSKLNIYEFLGWSPEKVGYFRRYDRSVQCLSEFAVEKSKRLMSAQLIGAEDRAWLFYADGDIMLMDSKLNLIQSFESVLKVQWVMETANGLFVASKDLRFEEFRSDGSKKKFYRRGISISGSQIEKVNEMRFRSMSWDERNRRIVCRSDSGALVLMTKEKEKPNFNTKIIWEALHQGKILDMDEVRGKPWAVTIGEDKRLCIWNYEKSRVEMRWQLAESALSVAAHPSGFYLCLGMSDRAVVMSLFGNSPGRYTKKDLKEVFLKNVYRMRFSEGGSYLALCSENPNAVNVYHFQTMHCPSFLALKGHNGRVRDMHFSRFNGYLFTCGHDGLLIQWNLKDGTRKELFSRGMALNAFIPMKGRGGAFDVIAAAREPRSLVVCRGEERLSTPSDWIYTCLAHNSGDKTLVAAARHDKATQSSVLRVHHLGGEMDKFTDIALHSLTGVKKLLFADEGAHLLILFEDDTIGVLSINGKISGLGYQDKILVTRAYIEDLRSRAAFLQSSLNDNQGESNNLITLGHLDDKIKELTEEIIEKKREYGEEVKWAKESQKNVEDKYREQIQEMKNHQRSMINELSSFHVKEISKQNAILEEYEEKKNSLICENEKQRDSFIKRSNRELSALQKKFKNFMTEKQKEKLEAEAEELRQQKENSQKIEIIGEEIGEENKYFSEQLELRIGNLNEENIKLKNQVQSLKKKQEKLNGQIEVLGDLVREKEKTLEPLKCKRVTLEEDIGEQKRKLKERNEKISEKETIINELKKEIQELEKYKFVLDFKIKDLNKDIFPKENELRMLKSEIAKEETRLKFYNTGNSSLGKVIEELQKHQQKLKDNMATSKETLQKQRQRKKNLKKLIYDCVQLIQDHSALKEKLGEFKRIQKREDQISKEIEEEYKAQIEYLEKNIEEFNRNIKRDIELQKADNRNYIEENVRLIHDVKKLRRELKAFRTIERADKIEMRKNKTLHNILPAHLRKLNLKEKRDFYLDQERKISKIKQNIAALRNLG